ncbi:hypothetical protein [Desulfurispora thermophila]|uniref:hypothetical protein n=1 Tax=Desulfurispora thermophila TaxID=265470 RepID=UPI0003688DD7|nr:hypothetical protein [Desulfurispora thermophila]
MGVNVYAGVVIRKFTFFCLYFGQWVAVKVPEKRSWEAVDDFLDTRLISFSSDVALGELGKPPEMCFLLFSQLAPTLHFTEQKKRGGIRADCLMA